MLRNRRADCSLPPHVQSFPESAPPMTRTPSPTNVFEATTTTTPAPSPVDLGRLSLIVISDAGATVFELPSRGVVTIGRGERCDVRIDHPSVSRTHLRLHLGNTLEIEDVSSRNGTRAGVRVVGPGQRLHVAIGEAVTIGEVTLLVQDRGLVVRQRRMWGHDYFENRTEEECQRCEPAGSSFALVHVHVVPPIDDARACEVFGEVLRAADVLGHYGPGEFEVLAPGADRAEADLRASRIEASLAALGAAARTGVAVFPADGGSHHALAARALAQLRGLDSASGERRVVVASRRMRELHNLIGRIAPSDISVLLLGETGVGKEVMAETIHRRSRRADGPFLRLNCAALSETLLESELFGHERGAFTGATGAKPGLLETAAGGTVLLDEVGELPLSVQVKLLRVFEERAVMRVGALAPIAIDVRFVAATNRDLGQAIARGTFREDLYYRLAGITVTVPPLRDRLDEIEPLARRFIDLFCRRNQLAPGPHLSSSAADWLRTHSWPGNLRELRNLIERAVLLGRGPLILPEHLPLDPPSGSTVIATPAATPERPVPITPPADHGDERARVIAALDACAGNQTRAAAMLGISRRTLVYRLDLYGLARPRKPTTTRQ